MKSLLKGEVVISGIIFLGAMVLFNETRHFVGLAAYGKLGPAYWPRFLLLALMALSLGVGINVLGKVRRGEVPPAQPIHFDAGKVKFFSAACLIVSYLILMKIVGFLVLTPFVMIAFMILLGERSLKWILTVPFALTLIVVILFTKAMYVPLPRGVGIFLQISHLLY